MVRESRRRIRYQQDRWLTVCVVIVILIIIALMAIGMFHMVGFMRQPLSQVLGL